jgi:hypothetical protein
MCVIDLLMRGETGERDKKARRDSIGPRGRRVYVEKKEEEPNTADRH